MVLREHITALKVMRTEICYKNAPMEDVVSLLKKSCRRETADFYQKAFEDAATGLAFSTAAERRFDILKKEGMAAEDIEGIRAACRVLGRYDSSIQGEQLVAAIEQLENNLQVLQKELSSKGRIYKTAGATIGIALALMVI